MTNQSKTPYNNDYTVNDRVTALRERRAALGQKRREYFLTDEEKQKVDQFIKDMRA